jgi:hypothetical protein
MDSLIIMEITNNTELINKIFKEDKMLSKII